jgi:hypothetical protein
MLPALISFVNTVSGHCNNAHLKEKVLVAGRNQSGQAERADRLTRLSGQSALSWARLFRLLFQLSFVLTIMP